MAELNIKVLIDIFLNQALDFLNCEWKFYYLYYLFE